MTIKMRRR